MLDSGNTHGITVQINENRFIDSPKIRINRQYQDDFPTSNVTIKNYAFTLQFSSQVPENECLASKMTINLLFGMESPQQVVLTPLDSQNCDTLSQIKLHIYMQSKKGARKKDVVKSIFEQEVKKNVAGAFLNDSQVFPFEYDGSKFQLRAQILDGGKTHGIIDAKTTQIIFEKQMHQKSFMLVNNPEELGTINLKSIQELNFKQKLSKIKVGGLSTQIQLIYRRIFASRSYGSQLVQKLGIDHVKGILLYGPPGTGKTLMARQISKILGAKIKIINGPQITDKFVGQAERKLRQIFETAIKDYAEKGNESPLHVIIFDQFDAIARKRGSSDTSIGDSIVNQLLTLIDGVESPKNILIIGITNRKELIDDALLRSGRLEVHVQIFLPSLQGRKQIFEIHLKKCKQMNALNEDVSVKELAHMCKNFTGAQIEAIVKSAVSYALEDHQNNKEKKCSLNINFSHFMKARTDLIPQFGQDEKEIEKLLPEKYISIDSNAQNLFKEVNNMASALKSGKISILITGQRGTGKSSLAALCAKHIDFSFTKFVSCDKIYNLTESQKVSYLIRIFEDAKRCSESCIILDDILRLIQYIPLGNRYNNVLLQLFLNLLKAGKQKNKTQVIIATAQNPQVLKGLGLFPLFTKNLEVGQLNEQESRKFLNSIGQQQSLNQLQARHYTVAELINLSSIEK